MRTQLITATAVLLLSAPVATGQTPGQAPARLVGTWMSAPDTLTLTSDFDRSVWGPEASSVRVVSLMVSPTGTGTLMVTKKVVDARGQTVPASTWIEEAQIAIGAPQDGPSTRVEYATTVASAVRRYPDDPEYRWPLDGLRVKVVTFTDGDPNTMEIRYETPEGTGSFWETLRKERGDGG